VYFDPNGRARPEYELYDIDADPLEVESLVGVRSGAPRSTRARELQREMSERLSAEMAACRTTPATPLSPRRS
jgi:hypothetical protein